jgi:hypothetical protein
MLACISGVSNTPPNRTGFSQTGSDMFFGGIRCLAAPCISVVLSIRLLIPGNGRLDGFLPVG